MENTVGCKQGKSFEAVFRHSASLCVLQREVGKSFVFFFTGRPEAFEFSTFLEASASNLQMRLFCRSLNLRLAVC